MCTNGVDKRQAGRLINIINACRGCRYFYGYFICQAYTLASCSLPFFRLMVHSAFIPLLPAQPAMLLVLLPTVRPDARQGIANTALLLKKLQLELGAAIHILKVDEASHPAVVHAFEDLGVPAFVLLRNGLELWRQQGLPEGKQMAALLLRKLEEAR